MTGRRLSRVAARREGGAATMEFYIIAFFVLIPLLMATLQLGMLMLAKNTVNLAALATARAGAATGGDRTVMGRAYTEALSPLYAATALTGDLEDVGSLGYDVVASGAYAHAALDVGLTLSTFRTLNPVPASFQDFGVERNGVRIIPVTGLETNNAVGAVSRQRRSDALLLKVEVSHCYKLVFPVIDKMILWVVGLRNPGCALVNNGVPIVSHAVVRMTVPPVSTNFPSP
jgi:Flp pilus assembly protein TadG